MATLRAFFPAQNTRVEVRHRDESGLGMRLVQDFLAPKTGRIGHAEIYLVGDPEVRVLAEACRAYLERDFPRQCRPDGSPLDLDPPSSDTSTHNGANAPSKAG